MKPAPTRSYHRLPFQELDPKRFEDLVRQLAYDFRRWKSLESIGRSGSDEGMDVRGIEIAELEATKTEDTDEGESPVEERLWVLQCKRTTSLGPSDIRKIVKESVQPLSPYGFVLAATCDLSLKTREALRSEMVAHKVSEFFVWSRGELEDMLYQAKNDRLLFAYFGISLQAKRRSLATAIRSNISRKKQLSTLLEGEERWGKLVLLRDSADNTYPYAEKDHKKPWVLCHALNTKFPGNLEVLSEERLAAITPNHQYWDCIKGPDSLFRKRNNELRSLNAWAQKEKEPKELTEAFNFWNEYIPEEDKAYLKIFRQVPIERIIAIDPLGDGMYPVPHIFVDFDKKNGPFTEGARYQLEQMRDGPGRIYSNIPVSQKTKTNIFPKNIAEKDLPPSGFDHSGKAAQLSKDTSKTLEALLTKARPSDSVKKEEESSKEERIQGEIATITPFVTWRDAVANPVLSSFVDQFRRSKHWARIYTRSVQPDGYSTASESIEFRFRLHRSNAYNSDYWAAGYLRFSLSAYGRGWIMEQFPPPPGESSNRYSGAPQSPKSENLTPEELEICVLELLNRVAQNG